MGADFEHRLLARRLLEEAVDFVLRGEVAPVDRQQVFPLLHVDAGLGKRRMKLRVPILAVEDSREPVAAAVNRVVGAQQAHLHLGDSGCVPPATYMCRTLILPSMSAKQVVEVGAAGEARHEGCVGLLAPSKSSPWKCGS